MKEKLMRLLAKLLKVAVCLLVIWLVLGLIPRGDNFEGANPMLVEEGELPLLIAHGGGNREFPDNTLEAFYNAYSVDPRVMMETDVSITKDNVVILSHDTTIDRKTNHTGAIISWNYTDLIAQEVDFGYTNETDDNDALVEGSELKRFTTDDGRNVTPMDVTYPEGVTARHETVFLATTLEELIRAFPDNAINVEIKQSGETGKTCLRAVLDLMNRLDEEGLKPYERVVLASFHDEIYDEFQRLQEAGEVPATFMCSPAMGSATKLYILQLLNLDMFYTDGVAVLQFPTEMYGFDLATSGLIDKAHRHNIAVHYWTINDPDEMRMLIDLGADGIMSDYPHRLKEVYEAAKAK